MDICRPNGNDKRQPKSYIQRKDYAGKRSYRKSVAECQSDTTKMEQLVLRFLFEQDTLFPDFKKYFIVSLEHVV